MAGLGFKKQFVAPIRRRKNPKDQTIRGFRKVPITPGERLYLFTGMRTNYCKKIGEAVCYSVTEIILDEKGFRTGGDDLGEGIKAWYHQNDFFKLNEFARRDGFKNWKELVDFWKQEHGDDCFPFHGVLIRYRLLPMKHWNRQVPVEKIA